MDSLYAIQSKNESAVKEKSINSPMGEDRLDLSEACQSRENPAGMAKSVAAEIAEGVGTEKLRALKEQIAAGTYHVSGEDIAAAMLNFTGDQP